MVANARKAHSLDGVADHFIMLATCDSFGDHQLGRVADVLSDQGRKETLTRN